jgi:hypothetical protein
MRHTGHASHRTLHAQVIVPLLNQIEINQNSAAGRSVFESQFASVSQPAMVTYASSEASEDDGG